MAAAEKPREKNISGLFGAFNVVRVLFIVMAVSVIGAGFIVYKLDRDLTNGYAQAVAGISHAGASLLPTIAYSGLFQLFAAVSGISLAAIFYSHKVVGPLYRFTFVFKDTGDGKIRENTRIRKTDQLQAMTVSINEMKAGLRDFVDETREKAGKLEKMADSLDGAPEPERAAMDFETRKEIASLARSVERLKLGKP
ncbi:MAG: hypothetical protein ACNS63_11885 [Candidatus Nitrospinota bacterium M3_3B_026]